MHTVFDNTVHTSHQAAVHCAAIRLTRINLSCSTFVTGINSMLRPYFPRSPSWHNAIQFNFEKLISVDETKKQERDIYYTPFADDDCGLPHFL